MHIRKSIIKGIGVLPFFLLMLGPAMAQNTINGKVLDRNGEPIMGVNVYLEGTYDGASSDERGAFAFETGETGLQTLVVSILGYEPQYLADDVKNLTDLEIPLTEAMNELNGVTLTAGTFEAGDNSKVAVLKPLDIVTTAGAVGDFVAALQTLPGTAAINEDGRLFVRGGTAEETQVFIDGLRVFQPFNATANNIPTRGRFSPFLFKGITFSTGGYSAEYGQALSSVLLLNTTDVPDQEKTDINIMSVGGGVGHTEIWGDESLSFNAQYINLAPYEALIPSTQDIQWNRPFESISGESVFRSKGERSLFKLYTGFNHSNLDIAQEDINFDEMVRFKLINNNLYFNTSYKHFFERDWSLTTGASVSHDTNDINVIGNDIVATETASHAKLSVKKAFTHRLGLHMGTELFRLAYDETFNAPGVNIAPYGFKDRLWATFVEGDVFFSTKLAMKIGARLEQTALLDEFNLSPRISMAYKSSEKGQFSLAYGDFVQNPTNAVLRFDQDLASERASHYLLNYQYLDKGKTFRAEAYLKDYAQLVKFDTEMPLFNSNFTNLGGGHAAGLDVFWRDNTSIKNLDYWLSYSYLDTQRNFGNFEEAARPNFAPAHSLSLVTKYWVDDLKSQVGFSYQFGSGRPFNDPNNPNFMAERTKSFNNLSLNWAYLIDQQKILYFSVNNVLGFNNINDYQYANTPNAAGLFERRAIRPAADSFFFVGFFWTLSKDGRANQLDNL